MPKNRREKPTEASDPIAMLMQDHKRVQKLFKQFEKDRNDPEACREIVQTACADLKVHSALETEIFYPGVRDAIENEDIMNEADVEHESAESLIAKLEGMSPEDPHYAATFTVLCEYVKHHIKEEEGEMFPQIKKADVDLATLGEEMRVRREELMSEMESVGKGGAQAERERAAAR